MYTEKNPQCSTWYWLVRRLLGQKLGTFYFFICPQDMGGQQHTTHAVLSTPLLTVENHRHILPPFIAVQNTDMDTDYDRADYSSTDTTARHRQPSHTQCARTRGDDASSSSLTSLSSLIDEIPPSHSAGPVPVYSPQAPGSRIGPRTPYNSPIYRSSTPAPGTSNNQMLLSHVPAPFPLPVPTQRKGHGRTKIRTNPSYQLRCEKTTQTEDSRAVVDAIPVACTKLTKWSFSPRLSYSAGYPDGGIDILSPYSYRMAPFETIVVLSDLTIELPEGVYGRVLAKEGTPFYMSVDILPTLIPPRYRHNVTVALFNHSCLEVVIERGEHIARLLPTRHFLPVLSIFSRDGTRDGSRPSQSAGDGRH